MNWEIIIAPDFDPELDELPLSVREKLFAYVNLLEIHGPTLGRPYVDTLNGSRHANMKELRFNADDGVWRVAFAFDPERRAVLLVAGDKAGVSESRFYRLFITKADGRFDKYLDHLREDRSSR